eukprot:TRINITY_DN10_c1_g1_i1.p1 TRINITY_DN10_c1_g1~~TRINITY_DN10_c1_g1_i1.p1  ORF type:complete len:335 (+),score=102.73 TRINITY_DN10_c1_g1_i1:74-1078(+)
MAEEAEKKTDNAEKAKELAGALSGGVCQYEIPESDTLEVEADGSLLGKLEYKCTSFGLVMKNASQLLNYINGRAHTKKLEFNNLTEDPDIKEKLEKLMELEKPHKEKKGEEGRNKFKELMEKKKAERAAMTPEERAQKAQEAKEKKAARIAAGEEPPRKKPKNMKFEPVNCYSTDTLLHTPHEVRAHFNSRAFWDKAQNFGCPMCGEGSAEDAAFIAGDHWKTRKHRMNCTRIHAMGLEPGEFGIRDDYAEDKTPYKCPITNKWVRGYKELKELMQGDEYAELAIEYADGCDICAFKSDDQDKVLNHYLSTDHCKRLHHLAYYGMDVSNYYVGA